MICHSSIAKLELFLNSHLNFFPFEFRTTATEWVEIETKTLGRMTGKFDIFVKFL